MLLRSAVDAIEKTLTASLPPNSVGNETTRLLVARRSRLVTVDVIDLLDCIEDVRDDCG